MHPVIKNTGRENSLGRTMTAGSHQVDMRASSSDLLSKTRLLRQVTLHGLGAVSIVILNIRMVREVAGAGHDASWRQAYAYFFKHRFQAGVDYAFTLGPYGYFFSPQYECDLYWLNFFIQIAITVLVAGSFVALAVRAKTLPARIALYGLAIFILPVSGRGAFWFVAIVAMTAVLLEPFRGRWAVLVLLELAIAFAALTKFGNFVVATTCVAAIGVTLGAQERWWRAPLAASPYVVFIGGLWLAAGQHVKHFPAFISSSLEIGAAYNQTMMLAGPGREIVLAGITASCLVPALLLSGWRRQRSLETWIRPALLLVVLAVLWKAGFLRQPAHTRQFFAFAALAALLIDWSAIPQPGRRRLAALLCSGAFIVATVANVTSSRLRSLTPADLPYEWVKLARENSVKLLRPVKERDRLETHRGQLRRLHDLPLIREAVGDAPVDMLAHRQGELFLNGLNYRPRPVFQGYQAGTPKLSRRNAEFFFGPRAPEFVLAWITPIDLRYPTSEDPETIKTVLWLYEPVLTDTPYYLLRRASPDPGPVRPVDLRPPLQRRVAWGEWVETGATRDSWQLLSLRIEPSLLGRARSTLYRPPFLYLETRLSDGTTARWRIHRGMIENGFILNPFMLYGTEMLAAYRGTAERLVVSFRVLTDEGHEPFFKPGTGTSGLVMDVELRTIRPLTAHHSRNVQSRILPQEDSEPRD